MTDNGKMSGGSWFSLECLIGLVIFGVLLTFRTPAFPAAVYAIIGALIQAMGNSQGVKSGGKMPEQAGDAKPGQQSQTKSVIETTSQAPPAEPEA